MTSRERLYAALEGRSDDRLGVIGGIEPTAFLNLWVDALGHSVEGALEEGRGGPFVLANSDSCPRGSAIEKVRRVVAAAW
jgi:uroporphyrinogen-III decarboxylase